MNLMRKPFSILLAIATALSFSACSNDVLTDAGISNPTEDSDHYVYVNAAIALPASDGTRSSTDGENDPWDSDNDDNNNKTNSDEDKSQDKDDETKESNDDFEYGHDYENDVRSVLLVITTTDNKYVTHTVVKGITNAPNTPSKFDFIVNGEIKHTALQEAYETLLKDNQEVNIYAYCNFTTDLMDQFDKLVKDLAEATPEKKDNLLTSWMDFSGKVVEEGKSAKTQMPIANTIWASRSFLMTNAEVFKAKFPNSIEDWDPYTDKDHPYQLNEDGDQGSDLSLLKPIKVERAAARLDFKDGSNYFVDNKKVDNTYAINVDVSTEATSKDLRNIYSVQLTRMALVNMSKNFYYLRRVSQDGSNDNSTVGGREHSQNYVVDTDYGVKKDVQGIKPSNASNYFNFPLYTTTEIGEYEHGKGYEYAKDEWYIDNMEDILNGQYNDTWNNKTDYKIWRYVTENTIPAADTSNGADEFSQQKTIQSVGIIFKGAIIAGKDIDTQYKTTDGEDGEYVVSEKVREALKASQVHKTGGENGEFEYPILYSYNNELYAGYEELVDAAAADGIGSPLYTAVNKALSDGLDEAVKTQTEALNNQDENVGAVSTYLNENINDDVLKETAATNGITVYEASDEKDGEGWGYYCYYFYWNRHNDNLRSGKMGIMEFATVRNNVYKLSVTSIGKLGHPRNPKHDPDPETPETPDEEPVEYIQVKVEVLPWVVRVNNITF